MTKRNSLTLAGLLALALMAISGVKGVAETTNMDTETVIATYRVKEGKEGEFLNLLNRQWPTLRKQGLVMDRPHLLLRGEDESKRTFFVEILTWKSHQAPATASQNSAVKTIWDSVQALVEGRLGHRGIEFPEVQVVRLGEQSRE